MYAAGATAFAAAAVLACGSAEDNLAQNVASADSGVNVKRDSAPVDPQVEAGEGLDAGLGPEPNCEKYCTSVTANCTGANEQYGSMEECTMFCRALPLNESGRGSGDVSSASSVACRQYWADSPAKTNPDAYCLAAGPFGGNACGDRCTAFCDIVLAACSPDAGNAPFADQPSCATACAGFTYRDAGTDGGGEGPNGPDAGDSLNCRLFQLREAVMHPDKCAALSGACKD